MKLARNGDGTDGICYAHDPSLHTGGHIQATAVKSSSSGKRIARLGDPVLADCGHYGHISTASTVVIVEGIRAARLGDHTTGDYVATIIEGDDYFDIP